MWNNLFTHHCRGMVRIRIVILKTFKTVDKVCRTGRCQRLEPSTFFKSSKGKAKRVTGVKAHSEKRRPDGEPYIGFWRVDAPPPASAAKVAIS
jgi:hypothetical protein